jgi:hypothetical protein
MKGHSIRVGLLVGLVTAVLPILTGAYDRALLSEVAVQMLGSMIVWGLIVIAVDWVEQRIWHSRLGHPTVAVLDSPNAAAGGEAHL